MTPEQEKLLNEVLVKLSVVEQKLGIMVKRHNSTNRTEDATKLPGKKILTARSLEQLKKKYPF